MVLSIIACICHTPTKCLPQLTEAQPYYQRYNLQRLVGKYMGCNQCFASVTLHQISIRSLKTQSLKDN